MRERPDSDGPLLGMTARVPADTRAGAASPAASCGPGALRGQRGSPNTGSVTLAVAFK